MVCRLHHRRRRRLESPSSSGGFAITIEGPIEHIVPPAMGCVSPRVISAGNAGAGTGLAELFGTGPGGSASHLASWSGSMAGEAIPTQVLPNFGALPPEISSARMYSGAGSGPLLAAASAWDSVAAELSLAATGYDSVISELATSQWVGPTSAAMVTSVIPFVAWLGASATKAEQAGAQARDAAAAYEVAFAMTVPPQEIAANRTLLMALIATNYFGQNMPAIAATEAQYAEMWAQDAAAMYAYAGLSATASLLPPLTSPPTTTSADGLAEQAVAASHAAATAAGSCEATVAQLLVAFANSAAAAQPAVVGAIPWHTIQMYWMEFISVFTTLEGFVYGWGWGTLGALGLVGALMFDHTGTTGDAEAAAAGVSAMASPLALTGPLGSVSANLGHAGKIGAMTAPPNWVNSVPVLSIDKAELSTIAIGATPTNSSGLLQGIPMRRGDGARGFSRRQYGLRLTVMSRPPGAG